MNRASQRLLVLLLLAYFTVGAAYACLTPPWQVPDEPAHYNYIRQLAEDHRLPVMEIGDYDQAYLSRLTAEHFPPNLSIERLEYEDHQPPLYYLLLAPFYVLGGGSLRILRLVTLLFGAAAIAFTIRLVEELFPEDRGFALFVGGLMAFVPQYVAMTAGVNNDALGIAFLTAWLWLGMRYLRGATPAWMVGLLTGLLLLTKGTAYITLPLLPLLLVLRKRRAGFGWRPTAHEALSLILPALVLGGMWWVRNVSLYGWPDLTGQLRHAQVVVGQPRTRDWIAQRGAIAFFRRAIVTTFRSFWGQFGWMGVVMDARLYRAAAILTVLGGWGALLAWVETFGTSLPPRRRDALILLGSEVALTVALYLGYNVEFVQHQGRYLFPALPTLMTALALGLRRLSDPPAARATASVLLLFIAALAGWGLWRGHLPFWTLAELGMAMLLLLAVAAAGKRWRAVWGGALVLIFYLWDWYALFAFILPQLG